MLHHNSIIQHEPRSSCAINDLLKDRLLTASVMKIRRCSRVRFSCFSTNVSAIGTMATDLRTKSIIITIIIAIIYITLYYITV